jgi:hypothetical protein
MFFEPNWPSPRAEGHDRPPRTSRRPCFRPPRFRRILRGDATEGPPRVRGCLRLDRLEPHPRRHRRDRGARRGLRSPRPRNGSTRGRVCRDRPRDDPALVRPRAHAHRGHRSDVGGRGRADRAVRRGDRRTGRARSTHPQSRPPPSSSERAAWASSPRSRSASPPPRGFASGDASPPQSPGSRCSSR